MKEELKKETIGVNKPEESVLIMSCLNPIVANAAINSAKDNNVKVVILEDKVIHDYIKAENEKTENKDSISIFLENESNRGKAKEHLLKLWGILTNNAPISEISSKIEWTRTQVVKRTTMSHNQASEVLQMLNAFGYIVLEDERCYKFRFMFDDSTITLQLKDELDAMVNLLAAQYLKYECSAVNTYKKTKQEIFEEFMNLVRDRISR